MTLYDSVFDILREYGGSYFWLLMLAFSIIFILSQKEKKNRITILWVLAFSILCLYNDYAMGFMGKFVEEATLYRFFWLVPVSLICAYALMLLLGKIRPALGKLAVLLLFFAIVLCNYSSNVASSMLKVPTNKYMISEDVLQAAWLIDQDKTTEVPKVAMPMELELSYRTYDADITMGIGRKAYRYFERHGYNMGDKGKYPKQEVLARMISTGSREAPKDLSDSTKELGIDYCILSKEWALRDFLQDNQWVPVGETDRFEIYRIPRETVADAIHIPLEGVKGVRKFLIVNDLHLIASDDTVEPEYQDTVQSRRNEMFLTPQGITSKEYWNKLTPTMDDYGADGVIFCGDMIDYVSEANTRELKKGLEQMQTPYIYLRADHDLGTWYTNGKKNKDDALALQREVAEYQDVFVMDYKDFFLVGWNNSTSQMSPGGLSLMKRVFSQGKPVILATHVPLNSKVDDSLYQLAKQRDGQNRAKLWGEGCLYEPDEVTEEFLKMVSAADSPVKGVLSGHLHWKYTVSLTDNIKEYVLAPAFAGNITILTVGG